MYARALLPLLGGSPATFPTALAFYQCALLLGVLVAHHARRLPVAAQCAGLVGVAVFAGVALPLAAPAGDGPPPGGAVAWLLVALLVHVGPPYVVLAGASPTLQRWASDHGDDPWPVNVAGSVGALAGLLAYPFAIEPLLSLADQARTWTLGYAVFVALFAAAALARVVAATASASIASGGAAPDGAPMEGARAVRWGARAAASSALVVAITTATTTDVAAFPLVWVLPLALYLGSWALAFSRRALPSWLVRWAWPFALVPVAAVRVVHANEPALLLVGLHLVALFVGALGVHTALADERPAPTEVSAFALAVATGGAVGGALASLVAPLVFTGTTEVPLALVAATLAMVSTTPADRPRREDLVFAGAIGLGAAVVAHQVPHDAGAVAIAGFALLAGIGGAVSTQRPVRLALCVAALFVGASEWSGAVGTVEVARRTFFGQHRVAVDGDLRLLLHGTTMHGAQRLGDETPLAYHHADGPLGQVFEVAHPRAIGVVGLGAGAVACHAGPVARTFYELDPVVVELASARFTFLARCAPDARIVLGDARLSLARDDARFDLLVLDAYSSDAIPVHLLTREAFAVYLDHLAPGGSLVFNTTNRHLDVGPVIAGLAAERGLVARERTDLVDEPLAQRGRASSRWVAVGPLADALATDPRWRPIERHLVWTDDRASLLDVLR